MKPTHLVLKRLLPRPLQRVLRGAANYAQRISIWHAVLREVRGATPQDGKILRCSALAAPRLAWGDFLAWRDPVLLADATVDVAGVGMFAVRAHSDELFIVLPAREPAVFAALDRCLAEGGTFVDAGANIGVFSVYAARRVGNSGHVVAIEMMPQTAQRLRANFALNHLHNATIVESALSDRAGDVLSATIQPGHAGRATLSDTLAAGLSTPDRLQVETTTLAAILADRGEIALMKMDIEGAELAALRGAGAALQSIRAIVFEQLDGQNGVSSFLEQAGYSIAALDHHNYIATRHPDVS